MRRFIILTIAMLTLFPFTSIKAARVEHEVVPLQVEFSQAELEQMLAPIALYPDTLLSHILIAATYPLEIIQAERWSSRNPDLSAEDINLAIEGKDWDPSVKALVPFPKVLKRMSDEIDWTQNLGDAFLQDEARVLAGIQTLRLDAENAGNLDDLEHLNVTREDETIILEPSRREVVYVPYYDSRVVYGNWRWSHYPPVYWNYPGYVSYPSHYYSNSPFYWGPSVYISFGYGFSAFNWYNHHIVVLPHHYRNHYYSRRQIVHHQHHSRWQHNPTHRRGASYRTTAVSNRYNSNRVSRADTRVARIDNNRAIPRNQPRAETRQQRISKDIRQQSRTREPQLRNSDLKRSQNRKAVQPGNSNSRTRKPSVVREKNNLDGGKYRDKKYSSDSSRNTQRSTSKKPSASRQKPGIVTRERNSSTKSRAPKSNTRNNYSKPKTDYRAPQKSPSNYKAPTRSSSKSNNSSSRSSESSRSSSKGPSKSSSKSSSRGSSRSSSKERRR